ncbi:response regulator transcription factor [Proteiniphilum saccharofermentans]|jgi:DNA-binding response OmpR family regulator|uniref:response regulator transcription factor n=1 Tax=Proteiniphilum saccharofermentans TaxID=1642647 RepID=UPI0028A5C34B|nr:response regulator transcription factor [Proteiniphilum saccharofermentans]
MDTTKIKVLLVDDDVLLGSTVVAELIKRGYEATYLSATYGVEDAIKQLSPDVLVFDVEIGKENGIKMAEEVFKGHPALPIIFISSHHEDETKEAGLMAGGVAYIDKPFSVKLLSAHIDRFTRMRKLTPEAPEHIISVGKTQLDTRNRTLILIDDSMVDLRPMEYVILKKLTDHLNEIVSREDIYYAIWKKDTAYYNEQSLNNYIRRVRVMLENNDTGLEVSLHRSLGYKLREKE